MKRVVFAIIACLVLLSCNNRKGCPKVSLLTLMSNNEMRTDTMFVIMETLYTTHFVDSLIDNDNSLLSCFRYNIELGSESLLQEILRFKTFPAIIKITPQKDFASIGYFLRDGTISWNKTTPMLRSYIKDMLRLTNLVDSENIHEELESYSIYAKYQDDFYFNYLLYDSAKRHKDSCALSHLKSAVDIFKDSNLPKSDPLYRALLVELANKTNTEYSVSSKEVDLGAINLNSHKQAQITIYNIGQSPIIIKNVHVDCSCLSVKYDDIIPSGEESNMVFTYNADINPGPFIRTCTISINNPRKTVIHFKGTVINN